MTVNRHSSSAPVSEVPSSVYADVLTEPVLDAALMRLLKPVNTSKPANTSKLVQFDCSRGWYATSHSMSDGMDVIEHSLPEGFDTQQFLALLKALH